MPYEIENSPLFKITSIHRLSEVLQLRVGRLRRLEYLTGQFKEGTTERNGKQRKTETPIRTMCRVHNRVQKLLSRIQMPNYLHSGKRKRSYLSNAVAHSGLIQSFQVDIAKFYPSCTWHHVYLCFIRQFQCSSDIAGIMATILTYRGHIPTGSPTSSLLAFLSHKEMFDALYELAQSHNLTMTVYQDDISFSGSSISESFRSEVRCIIKRCNLVPKRSKQRYCHGGRSPNITGVVLTSRGPKAPRSRHLALRQSIDEFDAAESEIDLRISYHRMMGRLSEIERVQGRLFDLKPKLKSRFRSRLKAMSQCPQVE
ncbi:MAG: RNA-directed DNA polymerase [Rhodospirillaceae bacterium]|nr:RNA-directed DNA polymerase [Rhodospirillaceae bacterium]MYB13593.1 RNA-directed DNA polymerase [Rhodospirillaceae bacterium]